MYNISRHAGYLLVKFIDDFDYPMIHTAIHHETMLKEYADTNDIWWIGDNRALICLSEIELMVEAFECRCSRDAKRTKTAVVVNEGLTGAIIEMWVNGLRRHVAFEIEIFRTLDCAKQWLGVDRARVA